MQVMVGASAASCLGPRVREDDDTCSRSEVSVAAVNG